MLGDVCILKKLKIKIRKRNDFNIEYCKIINNKTGKKIAKSINCYNFPILSNYGLHVIADTIFKFNSQSIIKNKFIVDDNGKKLQNIDDYDLIFGFNIYGECLCSDTNGNWITIYNSIKKNDYFNKYYHTRFYFKNIEKNYVNLKRFYSCYNSKLLYDISEFFEGKRKDESGNDVYDIIDNRGNLIFEDIYIKDSDGEVKTFITVEWDAWKYIRDYGCAFFEFMDEKLFQNKDSLSEILFNFSRFVKEKLLKIDNYVGEKIYIQPYLEASIFFITHILLRKGFDDIVKYIIKYVNYQLNLLNNSNCGNSFFDSDFESRLNLCSKDRKDQLELLKIIETNYNLLGKIY